MNTGLWIGIILVVSGIIMFVNYYNQLPLYDFGIHKLTKPRKRKIIVEYIHRYIPIHLSKRRRRRLVIGKWRKIFLFTRINKKINPWLLMQLIFGILIFWDVILKGSLNLYWGLPLGIIVLQGIKKSEQDFWASLKEQFASTISGPFKIGWGLSWLVVIIRQIT